MISNGPTRFNQTEYRIQLSDSSICGHLRTSRLFELLQAGCFSHLKKEDHDNGRLWIVIQQHLDILHMPQYNDVLTIKTWPGTPMALLCPIYYCIMDSNEDVCISGSSLWTCIDADTRQLINAADFHFPEPFITSGNTPSLPRSIKKEDTDHTASFTVPFSCCDANDHMNNASYFDLAEDRLPSSYHAKPLSSISVQYSLESRLGDTIQVAWNLHRTSAYFEGTREKNCFRIKLMYQPADE